MKGMKCLGFRTGLLCGCAWVLWFPAYAVDVASRISDREIIESLSDIRAEIKLIHGRLEQVDQRFEQVDQRFAQITEDMNSRFEQVDRRFAQIAGDMNSRFETLTQTTLVLFSSLAGLIIALFGYIIWDRRTALRPLAQKIEALERDLVRDLDLQHAEGSTVTRLLAALRVLAREDHKMAAALKRYSL